MKKQNFFCYLLIIISFSFVSSFTCIDGIFQPIFSNFPVNIKVSPEKEVCFRYKLRNIRNKIGIKFSLANSYTAEVLIYKSQNQIIKKNGQYINYELQYLTAFNTFKEIDVRNYYDYVYLIIKDSKNYFFYDKMTLFDSEVPIKLEKNKPIEISNFMTNNKFTFSFSSDKDIKLLYTPKQNSHKKLTIIDNNNEIIAQKMDNQDITLNMPNKNMGTKNLFIIVENIDSSKEEQEFSLVVYENENYEMQNIRQDNIITINYIKNSNNQKFYFYSNVTNYTNSASVNFKLDYLSKYKKYIKILTNIISSNVPLQIEEKMINLMLTENKLPSSYHKSSDDELRFYFQIDKKPKYNYIIIKVEIQDYINYYSPNFFSVSISKDIEVIDLRNIRFYEVQKFTKNLIYKIPIYIELLLEPNESYIFSTSKPDCVILRNGSLIKEDEKINNNFIEEHYTKDRIILNNISKLTIEMFGENENISFYLEKINK